MTRYGCVLAALAALAALTASSCLLVFDTSELERGCAEGEKACDGSCVSRSDPEYGCGEGSCQPCFLPNAQSVCDQRQRCAIASCIGNYEDCDQNAATGCEVNLDTDVEHCGACNAEPCEVPGALPACARGSCAIRKCRDGFKDCNRESLDGCEVDVLQDRHHCGACAAACDAGASCSQGRCE